MKKDKNHAEMVEITTKIQEFIQGQLTKTTEPLIFAGCLAAQIRHLYVALCGEETTFEVYRTMLEDLRKEVLKKESVTYSNENPTIH